LYLSERNIYGSSRLGMENVNYLIASTNATNIEAYAPDKVVVGDKAFELSNHLGNFNDTWVLSNKTLSGINPVRNLSEATGVLNTITDKKNPEFDATTGDLAFFNAVVVGYSDYYPFGMQMPERNGSTGDYRYGFNGMESDDEVKGENNWYTFGDYGYDPRIVQRPCLDPLMAKFPWQSPYSTFNGNPIYFKDPSGKSGIVTITEGTSEKSGTIKITMNVFLYGNGASLKLAQETEKQIIKRFKENSFNYMVNGELYNVELDLNVQYLSIDEACHAAKTNTNNANNFLRVEDFNQYQKMNNDADMAEGKDDALNGRAGFVSQMTNPTGDIGCNTGFLISSSLVDDPSELLHELTHGWGAVHQDGLNNCGSSEKVPATLPEGTPKSAVKNAPSNGMVLDMSKRTLSICDLNEMFRLNGFEFNSKGGINVNFTDGKYTRNVGSTENVIYESDGFYGNKSVCGN
jgi:hypothetical protein